MLLAMTNKMSPRLIQSDADLAEGCAHLSQACKHMARLVGTIKLPPLRRRAGGFEALVSIVISQQLSVAAADTIEARVKARLKEITPEKILRARDETLRACGLSRPKIRTLRALARAVNTGALDLSVVGKAPAEEARTLLTSVSGIGPWTADIYIMFCLGHADGFAPGDLALQEAARLACKMRVRPDAKRLERQARRWAPWRGVAARLLWAHYAEMRALRKKSGPDTQK